MSHDFLKAANKLKIVNYFDDLINKINLLVEIYICDNKYDQICIDEINKAREEWITEMNECQDHNLAELEKNEKNDELIADEQLFKRHCFFINLSAVFHTSGCFTGRFISTDVYLRPGQIECFQELLRFTGGENKHLWAQKLDNEQLMNSLNKIFVSVKLFNDVSRYYYGLNKKLVNFIKVNSIF
jgi:hypothetical protein